MLLGLDPYSVRPGSGLTNQNVARYTAYGSMHDALFHNVNDDNADNAGLELVMSRGRAEERLSAAIQ